MTNREVISGRQLILLSFTFIIATATLYLPSFVARKACQDGWISSLLAGAVGIIVILVVYPVSIKYPNLTLIEYSQIVLSKWIGKFVGLIFILFFIHITSIIIREVSSTIESHVLTDSTLNVITFILFIICAYAVKNGLEVITRLNIIILIFTFLAMFICLALLLKEMDPNLLTPILRNGILPVIKGAIPPSGWFGEVVSIAFLFPFINNPKEIRKCSIIGVTWASATVSFFAVLVTMVFGSKLVPNLTFPTLEAVRIINIGDYIQRAEIIFLIPWIMANITKICFFYYITVLIIGKWFNLKDIQTLTIPVGLLIFSLSLFIFKNSIDMINFLSNAWGTYAISIELGIPLLLLIVQIVKDKRKRRPICD